MKKRSEKQKDMEQLKSELAKVSTVVVISGQGTGDPDCRQARRFG